MNIFLVILIQGFQDSTLIEAFMFYFRYILFQSEYNQVKHCEES